ncbi:zinc finger protein 415-like isoform X10 [Spodoptera litura]|uniref:Zinc finger protein 415-like isoform X10 n=1 Tax=Spodoptera litura TaxID=69820 RepID=A0A9J7IM29_SPOLT|nr:zinc finger protein 415-like isoform X10 [Spodoptera litura]
METAGHSNMCRCCASEGAFKDIKSTYHWMGEEEIYADMLKDCFDINLNVSEHGEDGGICEVCITQLRNAINFKKQVQHTEEQFKKHLQNKALFRPNIVKVEVGGEEDSDGDNMGSGDDAFSGAEFDVPIKTEEDDPKPKKRSKASATTTRSKKSKSDDGEPSTKREVQQQAGTIKISNIKSEKKDASLPRKITKTIIETTEIGKHRTNVTEVMRWSNATPIRNHGDLGYLCSYCSKQYPEPANLKKHTKETHKDVSAAYFIKNLSLYRYIVKMDITDLECSICELKIDTTEQLLQHLKDKHNKNVYFDIKNHIIPFKFNSKALDCFICKNVFYKFKQLLVHMSIHYRNFVCKVCDVGFVNYLSYKYHTATHEKGVYQCKQCQTEFETVIKLKIHEKQKHGNKKTHRCGHCAKTFTDYRQKEKHLGLVHGKNHKLKCSACDKVFKASKHLNIHVRREHLLERDNPCKLCFMRFFSKSELKEHMTKHSNVKAYKCDQCSKSFTRAKCLKEHMRIHNNDKRFKCEVCSQAYVQKCAWRYHMKAKHGEMV